MSDIWPAGGPPQPSSQPPSSPPPPGGPGWGNNPNGGTAGANAQYIPPGQQYYRPTPPSGPPRRRQIPTIWIIGLVVLGYLATRAHTIPEYELIIFAVMVPSIILHEISHGIVALAFGDDTAKKAGRLTLNPLAHIDPIGTILIPAVLALSHLGFWGYAKPVPVNVSKLRSPRNQGVLVSLVGPATNFAIAALALLAFYLFHGIRSFGGQAAVIPLQQGAIPQVFSWAQVVYFLGLMNLLLGAFNLLPIPPLDGSVVIERMLPERMWPGYLRMRQYAMPVLFMLIIINSFSGLDFLSVGYGHVETWWGSLLSH